MKTVNSLSGGKTSSYIAVHYPADLEIFALCCIDCHNAGKNIDKKMKQMANDKLQKYCSDMPEFVATSEDPKILKVMFDLEQKIGREIIWLRGKGWEQMIRETGVVPNMFKRVCTTILKIEPIFNFLYRYEELPVRMRIGYRHDESHRAEKSNDTFKFPYMCEWREKSCRWVQRWKEVVWRINEFPLIQDLIEHYQIVKYWEREDIEFPDDSNCLNCFWKEYLQLRKNFDTDEAIMQWASIQEDLNNHTFKERSLRSVQKLPIQLDFAYGTGSGCRAGFCTD